MSGLAWGNIETQTLTQTCLKEPLFGTEDVGQQETGGLAGTVR